MNPCGRWVQVNCTTGWPSPSVHSKANISWLWASRGRLKKASFKSSTVYQVYSGSKLLRRVYGLGTVGCMSLTHLLTSHRSVICPPGFFTGSKGVFQGDWHRLRIPAFMSCQMWGVIPCQASWLMGYCLTLTGIALAFSSMTTGCLCFTNPISAVSAQTNGYLWTHGCTSSVMTSEGLGTKSLYSSLQARDKTCIGCPSPSVTGIPPGSKWI